ncbi:MAG: Gfo/Idh/MocA family protein [Candidatus Brocadiia bacterium]
MNEKRGQDLRVGIVGASSRGFSLMETLSRETGAVITGFADPSAAALERARERFGEEGITYAKSDTELYEHGQCDAVIVASGDPWHVENAEAALAHGKDVFLEKPISQTMDGLRKLVGAWRESDCIVMVGLELRHCVVFREMRRLIDDGRIGRPVIGMGFDNVSVGGRYYYHDHRRERSYTRSLVLQKGTHTVDLVNWYMGARPLRVYCSSGLNVYGQGESGDKRCSECDRVETCRHAIRGEKLETDYGEVQEIQDHCVFAPGAEVADNSLVLVDYDNGTRAFYGECHFTPEYTREFTLIGDRGKMMGFYNNACEFEIKIQSVDEPDRMEVFEPRPTTRGGHGGSEPRAMREFGRRLQERDRAEEEFLQVVEGTAICVAAADSEETGEPVDIPDFRRM